MHFVSSGAGKRRKSRTVESVGRQGGNGRRFGGRITARARGGTPARSGGGGRRGLLINCGESVGNAKTGSNPLDTVPPLLYPRPRRNPPWRSPPRHPEKSVKNRERFARELRLWGVRPPDPPAADIVHQLPLPPLPTKTNANPNPSFAQLSPQFALSLMTVPIDGH